MKNAFRGEKGIWTLAIGSAPVALALALLLFRAPPPMDHPDKPVTTKPASVGFRPVNATDTNISLLDPTPLFLPTEWNARHDMAAGAVREPGSAFGSFPAQVSFADDVIRRVFPPPAKSLPEKPVDVLDVSSPIAPFAGIGESDRKVAPLVARDAFVEITSGANGRIVLQETVRGARPPGDVNWQPLEFLAVIQASGLVGQPTLIGSGSGFESVDAFFQNYLAKGLHVGERLAPGFYRIKIGP